MRHVLGILGLIIVVSRSPAVTTFEKWYGGIEHDVGFSVQQTSDGGYIVAGHTYSFGAGSKDNYIIKTDSLGDTVWTRTYGGPKGETARSVCKTRDGGYVITGSYFSTTLDLYLVKIDSLGDTLWTRTYGGSGYDEGRCVWETEDGGYMVAGATASYGAGDHDFWFIRTDSVGDTVWTNTYGGPFLDDMAWLGQKTSDGGYVVTGWTYSFGVGSPDSCNIYLVKIDSLGDTTWTRTFGGNGNDGAWSVDTTSDGGYIMAGYTESYSCSPGTSDVYLLKADALGGVLWTATYGGSRVDVGASVQQTSDGGYIVVGLTESYSCSPGTSDVYLIRTDPFGGVTWAATFGGSQPDGGTCIQQTADGGYVIAGGTESFGAGNGDVYLIKTDQSGNVGHEEWYGLHEVTLRTLKSSPNPFCYHTSVEYCLPTTTPVRVALYNLLGQRVRTLLGEKQEPGLHSVVWDGRDDGGERVAPGVYLCRLTAGDFTAARHMVVLK